MNLSEAFGRLLRRVWCLLVLASCLCAAPAQADWRDDVGFDRLKLGSGSNLPGGIFPDGSGVPISLVEAKVGSNYFPDINNSEFGDVTFLPSPLAAHSTHADEQAERFFGNTLSVAPGANTVTVYEANNYLSNILNLADGNTDPPDAQDFRVQNFSWVGTNSSPPTTQQLNSDREALRRFDFLIDRDDVTALVGLSRNNTTELMPHIFSHSYNSIAVGRSDGNHNTGLTRLAGYGLGRSKPDLVAPINSTSGASAVTSSVATFLYSANTVQGTAAVNSEVMKAILMAGASKNETEFSGWSQFDTGGTWRPLDDKYGAGEVDLYNSYLITLDGQGVGGTSTVVGSNAVGLNGWDFQTIASGDDALRYDLVIPTGSTGAELSVILTWNAKTSSPFHIDDPVVADLRLEIVDSSGATIDLDLGDSGYQEGLSDSDVDNVEHVYLKDLAAGTYTIKVSSSDLASDFGLAWRTSTLFDSISADFDGDGDVDGSDFLTWQLGANTLLGASRANGDADGDGDVDSVDFAVLSAALHGGPVSLPSFALAVPEPATWVAAAVGLLLLVMMQRRHFGGPVVGGRALSNVRR